MQEILPKSLHSEAEKLTQLALHRWVIEYLVGRLETLENQDLKQASKEEALKLNLLAGLDDPQQVIVNKLLASYQAKVVIWQVKYPAKLKKLRDGMQPQSAEIEVIQKHFTDGYQAILQEMLSEAFELIGKPPCVYGWFGAGSYSRGEVLPYSDVEYLWLFEDGSIQTRQYFGVLNQLIGLQIHCVKEPSEVHPDQYLEVREIHVGDEKLSLPKTLQEIAQGLVGYCRDPQSQYAEILSGLQGRYIAGDATLWDKYIKVNDSEALEDLPHPPLLFKTPLSPPEKLLTPTRIKKALPNPVTYPALSGSPQIYSSRLAPLSSPRVSKPTTSLFPADFKYLDVFKIYRKAVLDFIMSEGEHKTSSQNPEAFFADLLRRPQHLLEKAVLLEAIEYGKVKLSLSDIRVRKLRKRILVHQGLLNLGKKPKAFDEKATEIAVFYQSCLKEELNSCQDEAYRKSLQQESDVCLILMTGCQLQMSPGKTFDEKGFFKIINERLVYEKTGIALYDAKLSICSRLKKPSLLLLWGVIFESLPIRLPLADLEVAKKVAENSRQEQKRRYRKLCDAFKDYLLVKPPQRWKQQWLYGQSLTFFRFGGKSGVKVEGSFHLSQEMVPQRFVIYEELLVDVSGVLGSTYFSADKPLAFEKTLCLDSNYQSGTAGATSDGYGHFASEELNRAVQQAAYRTVKLAVRYANFYQEAESLYEDLPKLFVQIGQAVKQSFLHPAEAGTASCVLTKVFAEKAGEKTLICGGVGDGMVMVWDPLVGKLQVLIHPRQYDRGGQFTPISITENLKGRMLQCCKMILPQEAFVIRMTDGAWELLPYQRSEKMFDGEANKHYLEYTLVIQKLEPLLQAFSAENPEAGAKGYRVFLQKCMQHQLEEKKSLLLKYQQVAKIKLKQFTAENPQQKTVGEFIHWLEQTDIDFHRLLMLALNMLSYTIENLKEATLLEFAQHLDKIAIGDDVTLHVEGLGQADDAKPLEKMVLHR